MTRLTKLLLAVATMFTIMGCASTSSPKADPWEGFNRGSFAVNEAIDKALLTPAAKGYQAVTPSFVRSGVSNAFGNVGDVGTGLNNLLQGKTGSALSDFGRVLVNSTLGILGLFDVASPMGLDKNNEDFGQTLGKWGVGSGPYLVLPLLGPSTLRDAIGRVPDRYTSYSQQVEHVPTSNSLLGLDIIRTRAELLATGKTLEEASLDKYQFLRDAFLQRRLSQVHDGKVPQALREKLEEDIEPPAAASSKPVPPK
ncbi:MAG: VacJ family lipoprotein [Rhodocyclaceae bacterium]|jgi:phospholipid-binding lipoprotein MlaA|nr:VacJ family lipoprotein [Rhodocyclaceae bacterium]MCA3017490.1 VacJ family lipoprotein [Rhodocyclaceae bacterium]MCA3020934.1 VacJ family lipoprotein [Rhodocyclaceae bacterium]MCA3024746.1 VacJ family lipoprotein [Rhodocyclaceae bacterium]MCA3027035.1 VacJ family lipoprotein [Rhodocyclaceae bacterium]